MSQQPNHRHSHGLDVCPSWLSFILDNPLRRRMHNPEKLFAGLVKEGGTAVDLGCGPGYFTVGMARLVGAKGTVIAVDLQEAMLERTLRRAERAGLRDRIRLHQAHPGSIGLAEPADFVLAFWMVHEVPDAGAFLREIREMLLPTGRFLLIEPRIHVSAADYGRTVAAAQDAGLRPVGQPKISLSWATLLATDGP